MQIAKSRGVLRAQVPWSEATWLTYSTKPTYWCGPQIEAVLKQPGYGRVEDRVRQREIRGDGRKNMSVSACLDEAWRCMLLSLLPIGFHRSSKSNSVSLPAPKAGRKTMSRRRQSLPSSEHGAHMAQVTRKLRRKRAVNEITYTIGSSSSER